MFKLIVLLVASTSAVKIQQKQPGGGMDGPPSCGEIAKMIYEKCNQGEDDRKISWKEAKGCGAPEEAKKDFMNAAGEDRQVDLPEFMAMCEAQFND